MTDISVGATLFRAAGGGVVRANAGRPSESSTPAVGAEPAAARGPAVLLDGLLGALTGATDRLPEPFADTLADAPALTDAEARAFKDALDQATEKAEDIATAWREERGRVAEEILDYIEQELMTLFRFLPLAIRTPGGLAEMARQAETMLRPAAGAVADARASIVGADDTSAAIHKRFGGLRAQVARIDGQARAVAWMTNNAARRAEVEGDDTAAYEGRQAAKALRHTLDEVDEALHAGAPLPTLTAPAQAGRASSLAVV